MARILIVNVFHPKTPLLFAAKTPKPEDLEAPA